MSKSTEKPVIQGIHLGNRGKSFKKFITNLLKLGKLKEEHIKLLTTKESMLCYGSAFTSETVDDVNNYQFYEQFGDLVANKFIVQYFYRRFPQLKCKEGVKVVARLRINYGSVNTFQKIADDLGFWDYISASNELRTNKKKSLLEDVFEAFLGVTEDILDTRVNGLGYCNAYKILKTIFDKMDISLKYEDLYDAKTRLKELFDLHHESLGPLKYEERKVENNNVPAVSVNAIRLDGAMYKKNEDGTLTTAIIAVNRNLRWSKVVIGTGNAPTKAEAEQKSAENALETLSNQGYIKKRPYIYSKLCGEVSNEVKETTEKDVIKICESKNTINELFPTKGRSKYQTYKSTALTHYCRKRDYEGVKLCLKLGSDINVLDSIGMTPFDALLVGSEDEDVVKKVFKRFKKIGKIDVHRNVFDSYNKYELNEEDFEILE
jgi:dsRNA-specific ribonuclease